MNAPRAVAVKQQNRLLAAIPAKELQKLLPHLREGAFKTGVMLQEVGDPIERVFFPLSGMISLLAVMNAGESVETATVGQEGAVGIAAGLYDHSHATGRAVVQRDGIFSHTSAGQFRILVAQCPALRGLISRYNDVQISLVSQVAGCNALHQVSARLSRWVLQTRDRSDSDILPLTHGFLAEILGVQRTTVTLLARDLQDRGLITYRRGEITIVDRAGLEAMTCECYETARRKIEGVFCERR